MKKRLFIAHIVSDELKKQIFNWKKQYEYLSVRWIPEENFHVTLIPPWYEENPESIVDILQTDSIRMVPIEYIFEKISIGPRGRNPWIILAKGSLSPELQELKSNLEKRLTVTPEKKEFTPHITLARFPKDIQDSLKNSTIYTQIQWTEKIDSYSLIESHLSPEGASYTILHTFSLN